MLEAVLSILAPVFDLVGLAGEATRRKRQVRVALTPIKNRLGLVLATVPLVLPDSERTEFLNEVENLRKVVARPTKGCQAPWQTELEELIQSLDSFASQELTHSGTFKVLSHARKLSESLA